MKNEMNRDDLLKVIEEAVDNVFLKYEEANGIKHGDISPFNALELDVLKESLADLIIFNFKDVLEEHTASGNLIKHVIEAHYSERVHGIRDIADTEAEANEKISEFEKYNPMNAEFRIVTMEVPCDPELRFMMVTDLLEEEGITIDDRGYFRLHISWGDWKHSHLRADYIMGLFGLEKVEEVVTESNGSDCYSAWRTYKAV